MIKRTAFILSFYCLLILPGCSTLKKLGIIPSELEMITGLKQALTQGLFRSFDAFADPAGTPWFDLPFPGMLAK